MDQRHFGNAHESWACFLSRNPEAAKVLIAEVGRILHAANLPAVLIGGQAVNCWVEPRITMDVDVTVLSDGAAIRHARSLFESAGFAIQLNQDGGGASGPDFFRFEHSDTQVQLDLQVAKTEYETQVVMRAVHAPDLAIPVATPEDLLVLKLIASRHKDFKDLVDLGSLPQIDWPYVETWSAVWEVEDRLANLRQAIAEEHTGI
jgi:hypothetical protein